MREAWRFAIITAINVAIVALPLIATRSSADQSSRLFQSSLNSVKKYTSSVPATAASTSAVAPPMVAWDKDASMKIGIQSDALNSEMAAMVRAGGAGMTRHSLMWSLVEWSYREPASYDFKRYDTLLGYFATVGLDIWVEFRGNPAWAATTLCGPIDKPGGLDAFARFVTATVQRYKQAPYNVTHWEFYNEPDGTDEAHPTSFVGCWGNDPEGYATMLRYAYRAVKAADPSATVILGGLASDGPAPVNMDFLDRVLAAGGADYFDLANVHFYSSQNPRWLSYGWDIDGKSNMIRATMAKYGVKKPLMVSEVGWTGTDLSNTDDVLRHAERQAAYVAKVLSRGLADGLEAVVWFSLADPDQNNPEGYPFGLVDFPQLQPRPAYRAFQTALAEFGRARSVRPLTSAEVGITGGVEGYAFKVGDEERWVLWMHESDIWERESAPAIIRVPSKATEVKDNLGNPIVGGVFQVDGSPIFVRVRP